jgi:serine/threonine-protein kinase
MTAGLLRGRYEPGESLGEGGVFDISRGRDVQTGRPVALKTLGAEFGSDPEFARRLREEAERSAALSHPGIVPVLDVWDERGAIYLATDFVRGINLAERIKRLAPFPLAVAIDIAAAIAEALQAATDAGVVHGDLRPENVIITPEGHVRVTDFGVGQALAASSRIQVAAMMRSARYLPPEVAQGRPITPASDVYSLGILLYQMLTGRVPFDGETPLAIAAQHLRDTPPSLRRQNPGVPKGVEAVVNRALQKDPALRYATPGDLLADLRGVREALRFGRSLDAAPAAAPPPRRTPPAPEPEVAMRPEPRRQPPPEAQPPPRRRQREEGDDRRGEPSALTLILVLFLAIGLLAGGFAFMSWIFRAPRDVSVPPVLRLSQTDATARLQGIGLSAVVEREEFDERFPAGTVMRVIPPAGSSVKEGRPVRIWVSKGPAPVEIPDVSGLDLKRARAEIRAMNLVVGRIEDEYSETVEKGEVIGQSPAAGESHPRKTKVSLVVSKGPEPIPEPEPEPVPPQLGDPNSPVEDRLFDVEFKVPEDPEGKGQQEVRIEVVDESGTHDVFNETRDSGETIRVPIPARGRKGGVIIRVYLDGRLYNQQFK